MMSVSVMLVMLVDLLRWIEHHQKVLAVTGKMLTYYSDKVGVVSLELNGTENIQQWRAVNLFIL